MERVGWIRMWMFTCVKQAEQPAGLAASREKKRAASKLNPEDEQQV